MTQKFRRFGLHVAKAAAADRLNRPIVDDKFHFELVRSLYSTPKSVFAATAVALAVVGILGALSGDLVYAALFALLLIIGTGRNLKIWQFHRTPLDKTDEVEIRRWEMMALGGAWTFATAVGLTGAYSILAHPATNIEFLSSCSVMGYLVGISSRNASRPLISIGQMSFTCVPFILALLLRADVAHTALALFVVVLYASNIVMCRSVFDNIIAREEAFRKIEVIAQRDELTGLWNRSAFLDLLRKRLGEIRRTTDHVALVSIDLDRFKDINDTLGHPAGDTILKEAAARIRGAIGPSNEVARIGGDEFLVMLTGEHAAGIAATTQRILAQFNTPFAVHPTSKVCTASIGYAVAPQDGSSLDVLLRNADLALYEAKREGREQIVAYVDAFAKSYDNRVALEHDLQYALQNGQLEVMYQPIVDARSGRTICCEALLRWNHPVRGSIPPSLFIPIAEATGMIVPIGRWVLQAACAEATHWRSDISLAVNLSPVQFRRGRELVHVVMDALATAGLAPTRLDLEITESVLIEDNEHTVAVLEELRRKGIGISLDDFGTGFSSLSYLNDLPFSKVKIDRKFSQGVDQSARTAAIIKGIAQTTRDLRIELVAEGIETESQLEHMSSLGVNAIQGYLFSKPLHAGPLRRVIAEPLVPLLDRAEPWQRWETKRRAAS